MRSLRYWRKHKLKLVIILVAALVTAAAQAGWFESGVKTAKQNQPGLYSVLEVYDGDTIAVDMNGKKEEIRMIGVDTPETHDPRKPVQCFGEAASSYTKQLIGSHAVRLEADPLGTNRDRYSRLLRYVYLPDGILVEAKIIQDGYGFAYTSFPFEKLEEFKAYEEQARAAGKGLWSGCQINTQENGARQTNPAN